MLKRSLRSSAERAFARQTGLTLLELLVASAIGSVLIGIAATTFIGQRRVMNYDLKRTAVTQNLRSTLDILGINIRLAGENLSSSFPAIELVDGVSGSPDTLTIRRNLLDEVLKVCDVISSGTTDPLYFAIPGTTPGCIYSDQGQNLSAWNTHLAASGGTALAYIFDPATTSGEFFDFTTITDNGSDMYLQPLDPWTNNYAPGQTAGYIIEEWQFSLTGGNLQLARDGDIVNQQNITYNLADFQVSLTLEDGSTVNSFTSTDDWTQVTAVNVSLSAQDSDVLQDIDRTLAASFFPRNVLSN